MKTIVERAKECFPDPWDADCILPAREGFIVGQQRQGYILGANEQKALDIDKACKWLKEQVYQEYGGGALERLIPDTMIEEFRKSMEEGL